MISVCTFIDLRSIFKKTVCLPLVLSLTLISPASFAQSGNALDFSPALTTYVDLGNLLPSGSYTREAWIYARNFDFANNIISGTTSAFWVPDGHLMVGHNHDYWTIEDYTPLSTDTWYHVVVTYDSATNFIKLYKNGIVVNSGIADGIYQDTRLFIGSYNYGVHAGVGWDGMIDEVRIWNVVRTQAEIKASMSCKLTGDEPGLLAYYDFEEGVPGGNNTGVTTLFDQSDKCVQNNGTLVNFTLMADTANWVTSTVPVSSTCSTGYSNIGISGNALCIPDGDTITTTADFTDFGYGNDIVRTFVIQNTGSLPLNITNIEIGGVNPTDFSVTNPPAAVVAPGGSTSFDITFSPGSTGDKTALVTVLNDDLDEPAYTFNILASYSGALPVTLKSFTVQKSNSAAALTWVTAGELNNKGFDIQRSANSSQWETIGFVAGAGTTSMEHTYMFADKNPLKGKNYYRLKQLDIDYKATYSQIRVLSFGEKTVSVYPVPASDRVIIELNSSSMVGSRGRISDLRGNTIKEVVLTKMIQEISLSSFPTGIYILTLADGSIQKIIKQ